MLADTIGLNVKLSDQTVRTFDSIRSISGRGSWQTLLRRIKQLIQLSRTKHSNSIKLDQDQIDKIKRYGHASCQPYKKCYLALQGDIDRAKPKRKDTVKEVNYA